MGGEKAGGDDRWLPTPAKRENTATATPSENANVQAGQLAKEASPSAGKKPRETPSEVGIGPRLRDSDHRQSINSGMRADQRIHATPSDTNPTVRISAYDSNRRTFAPDAGWLTMASIKSSVNVRSVPPSVMSLVR